MNILYKQTDDDFNTCCLTILRSLPGQAKMVLCKVDSRASKSVLNYHKIDSLSNGECELLTESNFNRILSKITSGYNEVWFVFGDIERDNLTNCLMGPLDFNSRSDLLLEWPIEALPAIGVGDGDGTNVGYIGLDDTVWKEWLRVFDLIN